MATGIDGARPAQIPQMAMDNASAYSTVQTKAQEVSAKETVMSSE